MKDNKFLIPVKCSTGTQCISSATDEVSPFHVLWHVCHLSEWVKEQNEGHNVKSHTSLQFHLVPPEENDGDGNSFPIFIIRGHDFPCLAPTDLPTFPHSLRYSHGGQTGRQFHSSRYCWYSTTWFNFNTVRFRHSRLGNLNRSHRFV